ncbi:MAG: HAD-IA family hydrolase [Myxococcales bacterium]|nr:HAD-IA family hydrolase [Myxococcales bacterium]
MQTAAMNRTLLLDAGNTLVYLDHSAVARLTGLSRSRLESGEGVAKRAYESFLATGADHADGWFAFMAALLTAAGAVGDVAPLVARVRADHDRRNLWCRVPDGLHDALVQLRDAGWRLGVVSNSEGRVRDILSDVGLAPLFEVIVDSGIEGISKPDPRLFQIALQRMGIPAEGTWYVGDVPSVDVDGARAAGLEAALVDSLNHYRGYDAAPRYRETRALVEDLRSGRLTNVATRRKTT